MKVLEALLVDDGRTKLVVLLFGHPLLEEGGGVGKDAPSLEDEVPPLFRTDHSD